MKAINLTTQKELAGNLVKAESLFARIKGLLGRSSLQPGEALMIKPCMGIHTVGMRFAIDVVFLDKNNRVLACVENLKPNRVTRLCFNAAGVLELPAGTVGSESVKVGDVIEIV